jgi:diacylglycerol kinase (ATP)
LRVGLVANLLGVEPRQKGSRVPRDIAEPAIVPFLPPGLSSRRLLVIVNPSAGRRRRRFLKQTLEEVQRLGAEVVLRETAARGDAEAYAREAGQEAVGDAGGRFDARFDAIVAAGGDGTANEIANGLAGSSLPLAVIPLGTANVLAHEIGMPSRAAGIARVLAFGPARAIWPGEIDGRRFLMMAGIGFDARVVEGVDEALKRHFGKLVFVREILRELFRNRSYRCRVVSGGIVSEAESIIFTKGHFYAGRFVLVHEARLEEPKLFMVLFHKGGRYAIIKYLIALARGRLDRRSDIRVVATEEAMVMASDAGPVEADGDIAAGLPVTVRIARTPLYLLRPE